MTEATSSVGPGLAMPLDPELAAADWTRSRRVIALWIVAAVVAALVALVVVTSRSSAPAKRGVRVKEQVQTGPTEPGSPALADGAYVRAAQLYSDPVFVDATQGFALARGTGGAASERLVTSMNAGATWHVTGAPLPVAGTFTTILFTSASSGYVFGPAGLLDTSNGGASWRQAPFPGEVVRLIPISGNVWAVDETCSGPPGTHLDCAVRLEISDDGGATWHASTAPPPLAAGSSGGAELARMSLDAAYLLTWGANSSGLAYTADSGATWSSVSDPCAEGWSIEDMVALYGGSMWLICGGTASRSGQVKSVYRSTDAGQQWSLVASTGLAPGAPEPIGGIPLSGLVSQLACVSPTIAWLGLGDVGVLYTSDGGTTWSVVPGVDDSGRSADVGVTFNRSPDGAVVDGWALAFGYALWRTTDATDWSEMASG